MPATPLEYCYGFKPHKFKLQLALVEVGLKQFGVQASACSDGSRTQAVQS